MWNNIAFQFELAVLFVICLFCIGMACESRDPILPQMLTLLARMEQTQNIQTNMLNTLLRQSNLIADSYDLPEGMLLPLCSIGGFEVFETHLKEVDTAKCLVSYLLLKNAIFCSVCLKYFILIQTICFKCYSFFFSDDSSFL